VALMLPEVGSCDWDLCPSLVMGMERFPIKVVRSDASQDSQAELSGFDGDVGTVGSRGDA
jgi:hypothetical protein